MSSRKTLPFPRLELRWTRISDTQYKCKYQIVISPPDELDVRSNSENGYGVYNVEGELSEIIRTGNAPDAFSHATKQLDTPFRDGVHIIRDGDKLNLPGFVTYKGNACRITSDNEGRTKVGKMFRYKKGA